MSALGFPDFGWVGVQNPYEGQEGGDFAEFEAVADGRTEDFVGIDFASGAETDSEVDTGVGIDDLEAEIVDFEADIADFEAEIVDFEVEIVDFEVEIADSEADIADDFARKNHHFADRADFDRLGYLGNSA